MEFSEAKRAIGGIQKFLRALNKLDEVLDSAIAAKDHLTQTEQRLDMVNNEMAGTEAKLADLKPKLAKIKEQYAAKMAEVDAKVQAHQESLEKAMNAKLEQKADELEKLDIALEKIKHEHEMTLEEYQDKEKAAKKAAEQWESKLTEAKAAYDEFKKSI